MNGQTEDKEGGKRLHEAGNDVCDVWLPSTGDGW